MAKYTGVELVERFRRLFVDLLHGSVIFPAFVLGSCPSDVVVSRHDDEVLGTELEGTE